jgi:hypothetical protein
MRQLREVCSRAATAAPRGRISQRFPGGITVAADPNRSGVVYAWVFMNLANGSIRKSIDGGVTWATIFPTTAAIFNITIDPGNSDVLYAPTVGHGAFKSIDGGQHWSSMTARTGGARPIPVHTWNQFRAAGCVRDSW